VFTQPGGPAIDVARFFQIAARKRNIPQNKDEKQIRIQDMKKGGTVLAVEDESEVRRDLAERTQSLSELRAEVASYRVRLKQAELREAVDPLTGLANRREIDTQIEGRISGDQAFCLAILDLNGFKRINDIHGHLAGDDLMKQFAAKLKSQVRTNDVIGRWGGDEFVIVVDAGLEEAQTRMDRIRRRIFSDYNIDSGKGTVSVILTASIGIAEWDGKESLVELLARADKTMYDEKRLISLTQLNTSGESSSLEIVTAGNNGGTDSRCTPRAFEHPRTLITRTLETSGADYMLRSLNAAAVAKCFLGRSPRMKEVHALIERIGWCEAPTLIQGETGSGKEVVARDLHARSPRSHKPFLKLNCAALPSELVESELFGYERGAFTGAFQKKTGMFEMADGGTILLDEVGDMDVKLQAKLLQVLQDHAFQRIGGTGTIKVDVRVIAATHRDLERAIVDGSFREDLYYRLNVINIVLPPLRERKEDIIPLAEFLLKKHAPQNTPGPTLTADLKDTMMNYHWPGNVRELENVVRRFLILKDPDLLARELHAKIARRLTVSAVMADMHADPGDLLAHSPNLRGIACQAEIEAIVEALNATRWNRKQAAVLLNIHYKALLYKMKKLGIDDRPIPFETATQAKTMAGGA
jgi:diguanylate cyclase (GGDEF)-like protein